MYGMRLYGEQAAEQGGYQLAVSALWHGEFHELQPVQKMRQSEKQLNTSPLCFSYNGEFFQILPENFRILMLQLRRYFSYGRMKPS